ncbi:CAF17-like 4Fe-4S cluster assembly/insertion protein YgfZ [Motilibacter aurantiacus]|uniref:CAF17-like 4Fe-4S cluster assembly/insertion protein YgfZ n=1 Tax=Motilibacter aurantiacus TaxID=2714955 RepID=UPI001409DB7F|nr:folate-binding protein YgfZ [Motilibacter aurantiacus]NHC46853.1 folate-binding protein YgfZ [Motilibacter aurantiacus]
MSVETSVLLSTPGAVAAEPPDERIAWHYGDPLAEQRRLEQGIGLVDLSDRGVVRVTGAARLGWLHDLTSQFLRDLPVGTPTELLVLDPNGRVETHANVVDDGTSTWMTVEPGAAGALAGYLLRMRFWTEVEVEDVTAAWAAAWEPVATPHERLLTTWLPHPALPLRGREVLVPRAELAAYAQGAGPLAGRWAYDALRVAAGVPRPGVDTDERTIPHEAGWLTTAVHLDKGCYRGQETVARVHNLGRPPRRLVLLHLDGSAETLPAGGAQVEADGRPVGTVGTVVQHHELGPVALALVKRSVPLDARLLVAGVAAAQEEPALLAAAPEPPGAGRAARTALRSGG